MYAFEIGIYLDRGHTCDREPSSDERVQVARLHSVDPNWEHVEAGHGPSPNRSLEPILHHTLDNVRRRSLGLQGILSSFPPF